MSLTSLTTTAAEVHSEPVIHPYLVGTITLAILMALPVSYTHLTLPTTPYV